MASTTCAAGASSRARAAASIRVRARIDLLVDNAGIGARGHMITRQGFESTIATNHLGPFALAGLLLGLFRTDHDPRVVTVGSGLYRLAPRTDFADLAGTRSSSPGRAYIRSDLANLLFGTEPDRRLRAAGSPVRSFVAQPGMARTPMQEKAESPLERAVVTIGGALLARAAAVRRHRSAGADRRVPRAAARQAGALRTAGEVGRRPRAGRPALAAVGGGDRGDVRAGRHRRRAARGPAVTSDMTCLAARRTHRAACETREP